VVENPIIKINDEIAGESAVCENSEITLEASGLNNGNYIWYDVTDNTQKEIANSTEKYTTTITTNKKYRVEGKDENECPGSATFNITTKGNPTFKFNHSPICVGENAVISLTERSENTRFAWSWENGLGSLENATSVNHKLESDRKYIVTAIKDNCIKTDSTIVAVNPLPEFEIVEDTAICYNEPIELSVKSDNNNQYSFEWTDIVEKILDQNIK
jgi:hypothetical protein